MSELVVHKVTVQQINANGSIGAAGQVLRSDGNFSYWGSASASVAAGANGELQFNSGGSTSASSNLTFDILTSTLSSANIAVPYTLTVNSISANGSIGLPNQVLKTNGTSTYWANDETVAVAGANMQVQFNNNGAFGADSEFYYNPTSNELNAVNITSTGVIAAKIISANGSIGAAGQVLASDGINVYWAPAFNGNAAVTFANTALFNGNVVFSNTISVGALSANGSTGTAGQILASNGTNTYWTSIFDNYIASGTFAANNTTAIISLVNANTSIANVTIDISQSITNLIDVDTFTNSPTANQVLSWDSNLSVWKPTTIKAGVTIADAAPATPSDGQLWYDSLTTYRTFVWSTVANAWVDVAPSPAQTIKFLNDLSDVDTGTTPPVAGSSLLGWDGLNWVPVISIDASSGLANDF